MSVGTRYCGFEPFRRTFFLLALLLVGSILAWLQNVCTLEFEPRAIQTAQQIASLVNLSRAALIHSDAIARVSLIKTMTEQESVRIVPREPDAPMSLYMCTPWASASRSNSQVGSGRVRWSPTGSIRRRTVGGIHH